MGRLGAVGVKEQLTEPWGILTACLLGGLGGAVTAALGTAGLGLGVGLAIAGSVYGVRVGLGALVERDRPRATSADFPGLPAPSPGSPADGWQRRAEAAVGNLHRLTESPRDPTLREQIGGVDDQAAAALSDLRRFAGQVTLVEQAARGIDPGRLRREQATLQHGLAGLAAGPLRDERERALRAVEDQLDVGRRLEQAHETLLARMQSAVLGLEGLVARMAELIALHATTGGGAALTATRVAELAGDLEGMRAGLAEAEELSRTTMTGGAPQHGPHEIR